MGKHEAMESGVTQALEVKAAVEEAQGVRPTYIGAHDSRQGEPRNRVNRAGYVHTGFECGAL